MVREEIFLLIGMWEGVSTLAGNSWNRSGRGKTSARFKSGLGEIHTYLWRVVRDCMKGNQLRETHVFTTEARRSFNLRSPGMGILQEEEESDCELKVFLMLRILFFFELTPFAADLFIYCSIIVKIFFFFFRKPYSRITIVLSFFHRSSLNIFFLQKLVSLNVK